jgi:putative membrane protein
MIEDPYRHFQMEEMILRDWLALDRTVLANKRTFLAYGRTSIALMALGIAFVKLIKHQFFEISGFALIGIGVVVFFVGLWEFNRNTQRFRKLVAKEQELEARLRSRFAQDCAGEDVPADPLGMSPAEATKS